MKSLLFDQNISPRLVERLADIYPGSAHVFTDIEIWQYAHNHDYMIVTKDADFSEFGVVKGFPPKIIWIRRGNCSTQEIETIMRGNLSSISALSEDSETGILTLF